MAPHPRRFIIFNNPPSAAIVNNHDTWADTTFVWHKLLLRDSPSPEPEPEPEPEPDTAPAATPSNPDQTIPSPPSVLLRRLAAVDEGGDTTVAGGGHETLSQSRFRDAPSPLGLRAGVGAEAEAEAEGPSPTSSALMPPPARQPRRSGAKRARRSEVEEGDDEDVGGPGRAGVYANNLWGEGEEESYAVWEREATRVGMRGRADDTVEDSFEGATELQGEYCSGAAPCSWLTMIDSLVAGTQLLPPPSASAATASQLPPRAHRSLHPRHSNILAGLHAPDSQSQPAPTPSHLPEYTFSTTSDSTSNQSNLTLSSPALPPNLPWDHFAVRDLLGLRAGLARQGARGSVQASVLGLVVDVSEPREVGERGKRRAGFEVEDPSGGRMSVVLWEEWVGSWHGVVRRGDIVFLGGEQTETHVPSNALRHFLTRSLLTHPRLQTSSSTCTPPSSRPSRPTPRSRARRSAGGWSSSTRPTRATASRRSGAKAAPRRSGSCGWSSGRGWPTGACSKERVGTAEQRLAARGTKAPCIQSTGTKEPKYQRNSCIEPALPHVYIQERQD